MWLGPLLAALVSALPHPDSVSWSVLAVDGERIGLAIKCQVASLIEVLPSIDADMDGAVTAEEVEASAAAIEAYVGRHYRVSVGTDRALEGGRELEPRPVRATHVVWDDAPGRFKEWVEVELHFDAGERVRDVAIESSLFLSTSPNHRDALEIEWPGRAVEYYSLDAYAPTVRSDPEGRGAFVLFARRAWSVLGERWDVLVFAVALALFARRRGSGRGLVTGCAALVVGLAIGARYGDEFARYVPILNAAAVLSIAYVGTDHLLLPPRERFGWLEPALFGVVFGCGLGADLVEPLFGERAPFHAWLGYATVLVGSALGCGLATLALIGLRSREPDAEPTYLAPRGVRRVGAATFAALGFFLFFLRV